MQEKMQLFTCMREGLQIRGMQCFPDSFNEQNRYPVMIISHGFTGDYTETLPFGKLFAELGYVAFCFSFCGGTRNHADDIVKSEGKTEHMSVLTEVADVIAVKEYAKSLPYVDASQIILMGFSQGGFVSGLAAAACQEEIKKLIMVFPALCIPDHARRGQLRGTDYDPNCVPEYIQSWDMTLGEAYHDAVVGMEPYLELSPYKGDVLIMHGLADDIVDYSYSMRARDSYQPGQCKLHLIKDFGHGCNEKQQRELVNLSRQFLCEREEILTFQIFITREETQTEGDLTRKDIFFTGYCESQHFQGAFVSEGCDKQEYRGNERISIRAEYELQGLDSDKKHCTLHVVNQWKDGEWMPGIKTDSNVLSWLNDATLYATLEFFEGGLTVRVFSTENII